MPKNTLIILGVAVLLLIGFMMLNNNQTSAPTSSNEQVPAQEEETTQTAETTEATESTIVEYTDNGFTPAQVTVDVGTTVTFKNNTSSPMWVASNPHPVHTAFSQFDAKKGFGEGESYPFTFEKAGEYGYHNHLSPLDGGVVIVK